MRPKDWNPREWHGEHYGYTSSFTDHDAMLMEDGADAILEGLKKKGVRCTTSYYHNEIILVATDKTESPLLHVPEGKTGYLVFIEDTL